MVRCGNEKRSLYAHGLSLLARKYNVHGDFLKRLEFLGLVMDVNFMGRWIEDDNPIIGEKIKRPLARCEEVTVGCDNGDFEIKSGVEVRSLHGMVSNLCRYRGLDRLELDKESTDSIDTLQDVTWDNTYALGKTLGNDDMTAFVFFLSGWLKKEKVLGEGSGWLKLLETKGVSLVNGSGSLGRRGAPGKAQAQDCETAIMPWSNLNNKKTSDNGELVAGLVATAKKLGYKHKVQVTGDQLTFERLYMAIILRSSEFNWFPEDGLEDVVALPGTLHEVFHVVLATLMLTSRWGLSKFLKIRPRQDGRHRLSSRVVAGGLYEAMARLADLFLALVIDEALRKSATTPAAADWSTHKWAKHFLRVRGGATGQFTRSMFLLLTSLFYFEDARKCVDGEGLLRSRKVFLLAHCACAQTKYTRMMTITMARLVKLCSPRTRKLWRDATCVMPTKRKGLTSKSSKYHLSNPLTSMHNDGVNENIMRLLRPIVFLHKVQMAGVLAGLVKIMDPAETYAQKWDSRSGYGSANKQNAHDWRSAAHVLDTCRLMQNSRSFSLFEAGDSEAQHKLHDVFGKQVNSGGWSVTTPDQGKLNLRPDWFMLAEESCRKSFEACKRKSLELRAAGDHDIRVAPFLPLKVKSLRREVFGKTNPDPQEPKPVSQQSSSMHVA